MMLQNDKRPLIGSNRKPLKAAGHFAECAVEELAWVVAAHTDMKLSFGTIARLREHLKALALLNMQSLADALIEEQEVGRPPALSGAGSGPTAPDDGAAEPPVHQSGSGEGGVSAHPGCGP